MIGSLQRGAVLALYLYIGSLAVNAAPYRPNEGRDLYIPAWGEEYIEHARSCERISQAQCAELNNLIEQPFAYWLGFDPLISREMHALHALLLDAKRERRVPTIVLYNFPHRDCGGPAGLGKQMTEQDYIWWLAKIADAVKFYKIPAVIIVEPGSLPKVVTNTRELCDGQSKRAVLEQWSKLIRSIIWEFEDRENGVLLNPYVRLFVDVGGPDQVTTPEARLQMVDVLQHILNSALFSGVTVNIGGHSSFQESVEYAKRIISLVRTPKIRDMLTIAVDIGGSRNKVLGCNASGAALDTQQPTLSHSDPRIELAMIIKKPGASEGEGEECNHGAPVGSFDKSLLDDYLKYTAARNGAIKK